LIATYNCHQNAKAISGSDDWRFTLAQIARLAGAKAFMVGKTSSLNLGKFWDVPAHNPVDLIQRHMDARRRTKTYRDFVAQL
jgi:hypothetical protein